MASITTIADDFDGSTPAETITFYLDGTAYQIDLNEEHAEALQEIRDEYEQALSDYLDKARKVVQSNARSTKAAPSYDAKEVRLWAAENGVEVNERGRIPSDVVDAYNNRNKK